MRPESLNSGATRPISGSICATGSTTTARPRATVALLHARTRFWAVLVLGAAAVPFYVLLGDASPIRAPLYVGDRGSGRVRTRGQRGFRADSSPVGLAVDRVGSGLLGGRRRRLDRDRHDRWDPVPVGRRCAVRRRLPAPRHRSRTAPMVRAPEGRLGRPRRCRHRHACLAARALADRVSAAAGRGLELDDTRRSLVLRRGRPPARLARGLVLPR